MYNNIPWGHHQNIFLTEIYSFFSDQRASLVRPKTSASEILNMLESLTNMRDGKTRMRFGLF